MPVKNKANGCNEENRRPPTPELNNNDDVYPDVHMYPPIAEIIVRNRVRRFYPVTNGMLQATPSYGVERRPGVLAVPANPRRQSRLLRIGRGLLGLPREAGQEYSRLAIQSPTRARSITPERQGPVLRSSQRVIRSDEDEQLDPDTEVNDIKKI